MPNPVAFRMEGGTGHIRLKEFNALAEPNVWSAVETLRARGATSFVLDLRDNPGGLVQAGVEIARLFLPPATAVAYTEGRVVAGGVGARHRRRRLRKETEAATRRRVRRASRARRRRR